MLVDFTVTEFMNKVAGSEPVPGGGSIAALNGAIAASLTAMVAGLTIGKKNYAQHEALMERIQSLAMRNQSTFLQDVDRDAQAYFEVFDSYKLPKATNEEKSYRHQAIQDATRYAALVPMQVARKAFELMTIINDVARYGNKNAVTDACVAMMSARTAVLAALMNVRINLGSLDDKAYAEELFDEADRLEMKACKAEQELMDTVKQQLSL